MNPYQYFQTGYDNRLPANNGQVRGLFTESSRPASGSSIFGTSYQAQLQNNIANYPQPENDTLMEDAEAQEQATLAAARAQPRTTSSRPAKSQQLDWKTHKPAIKRLYIDQNKSLPETMQAMDEQYSFKASQKLYKTKFKEWRWQKNLSAADALVMAGKAKRRKREEGKDTEFSFGGRIWDCDRVENTLSRANITTFSPDMANAETPQGMSYRTPQALVDSPSARGITGDTEFARNEISGNDIDDDSGDPTDLRPFVRTKLALTWQGYSRTDLQEMWRIALKSRNDGRFGEAEDIFKKLYLGLSRVLGKTNEDTTKAAYNLADLYADSNRMNEASDVLENIIQDHINVCGYEDRKTQQNILHAVELLNGWNRQADALGLLSLSGELLQSSRYSRNNQRADSQAGQQRKAAEMANPNRSPSDLSMIIQLVNENLSPESIEYGLGVARTHVAAKNEAVEGLLLAMIKQCESHPDLGTQHLKAQAELIKLYDKMGQAHRHQAVYDDAIASVNKVWEGCNWEEEIESFDFMEAVLQLFANLLKRGYQSQARLMFRKVSDKGSEVFGFDDERTVWILISVGLVYQTYMTWSDAAQWFEEAFAVALANKHWGPKDGIVRSLQNALDHQHFSYVSDKGRPFKTIFGVSGLTVRPGRLHLE